ncbi:MAG: hypothetical protein HY723_04345 [Chloroflexi bacterium]|nr:hypothetical protein [Chloroflexota bacterium]
MRWLPAAALLALAAALAACGGDGGTAGDGETNYILTPDAAGTFDAPLATYLATTVGTLPTQGPEATPTLGQPRPPEQAARGDLAARFAVSVDEIEVVSVVAMDWPDACLGLAAPGEVCAQVVTPGFEVTLAFGDSQFVYRTNENGTLARFAGLDVSDEEENN